MKFGEEIFTSSGTFTVPKRISKVKVFSVGGGGKGGKPVYANSPVNLSLNMQGTGGGGGYTNTAELDVIEYQNIDVSIGSSGGNTIVGSIVALSGEQGSKPSNTFSYLFRGGNGGSGGGGGGGYGVMGSAEYNAIGGGGGSNGSNGYGNVCSYPFTLVIDNDCDENNKYLLTGGNGQGTTTRAFGESNGTLYAGGGAGTGVWKGSINGGVGGAGGGGNSNCNGDANTGGGGSASAIGGSGIAIIRWGY